MWLESSSCRSLFIWLICTPCFFGEFSSKGLKPPSQLKLSLSPHFTVSSSPPQSSVQWIQRRQRTLHYTVLCLPKSLVSKRSTDFVAALSSSPLQPLSCKWSWMLFSKECILKRNSHFCLCILSQTLFSSISSPSTPPPFPPSRRSRRLHNWCKYCHMCQEWRLF